MSEVSCRHFNGYKPCSKNINCDSNCPSYSRLAERVLIVHLEALGAVMRSTSLLQAVKRRYPSCHITWVTKTPADQLLVNIPEIDRLLTTSGDDLLTLRALDFDLAFVIDKSLVASGIVKMANVGRVLGFRSNGSGAILPANQEAHELWRIGLSDQKKFLENQKSEQRLTHESLDLGPYTNDEYIVSLTDSEKELVLARRQLWRSGIEPIIGINTGCSPTLPHRKLSIEGHRKLIQAIRGQSKLSRMPIVLLGGREEKERNEAIAHGLNVELSPTQRGLRDGLVSVAACDLVFSGDSLGMHMAIGLKKWVVAWFGPSCAHEIELYGRGRKILTSAPCSPCWKRVCHQETMCYDQLDFAQVTAALIEGTHWHTLSFKPHSQEMSFSPSPY